MCRRIALVADDCPVARQAHAGLLDILGYSTTVVTSGKAAADEVRRARDEDGTYYDLILLDFEMPDGDGPAAARSIRAMESGPHMAPLICVTAHLPDQVQETCSSAGFNRVLTKPLDLDTLAQSVIVLSIARLRSDGRSRSMNPATDEAAAVRW